MIQFSKNRKPTETETFDSAVSPRNLRSETENTTAAGPVPFDFRLTVTAMKHLFIIGGRWRSCFLMAALCHFKLYPRVSPLLLTLGATEQPFLARAEMTV